MNNREKALADAKTFRDMQQPEESSKEVDAMALVEVMTFLQYLEAIIFLSHSHCCINFPLLKFRSTAAESKRSCLA
jgi:hypothetical protein